MASFFEHTRRVVDHAAVSLAIPPDVRALIEKPERVLDFEITLPHEHGETRVYKAWRVQHSSARGPYKGGIRFHPASNLDEAEALASLMTWKTAVAGIPYGGGKGAVRVDPKTLSPKDLESLSRSYVRRIFPYIGPEKDIPAPDVGTNAAIMGWMTDEYAKLAGYFEPAAFTGKPIEIGGSRGREAATGFGGAVILREFLKRSGGDPKQSRVAIQGFGNVGSFIARDLYQQGYRVVGLSDSKGAIANPQGFRVDELMKTQQELSRKEGRHVPLAEASGGSAKECSNEELLAMDVDILIPAALEGVITEVNAPHVRARVILEMANGPITPKADAVLEANGVHIVPDILANAGGVVGSYFEWAQGLSRIFWSEEEVLRKIDQVLVDAFHAVQAEQAHGGTWREASYRLAIRRVLTAMRLRGWI